MTDLFTFVIPTMWRYEPFTKFLRDLLDHELVHEVIIINNDSAKTPTLPNHDKLRLIDNGRNIYVNPSWNQGVRLSKTENVVITNDDIIFDLRVLKRVQEINDPNFGLACLCPGEAYYKQPPFKDGTIDIVPWTGWNLFGFGQLMFIKKSQHVNIPYQLQIYYGDDWILQNAIDNFRNVYAITNILHYTPFAVTSHEIVTKVFNTDNQTLLSQEKYWFDRYSAYLQLSKSDINLLLEKEYQIAKNTPSDINEHVETLYNYGLCCNHITELGVRTGISTRAFLNTHKTLISYDIVQDEKVQELFYAASKLFHARYHNANSLDLRIDPTDLLFIDTDHSYKQLSAELALHGNRSMKYIVFHDTTTYAEQLIPAISEFVTRNRGEWIIDKEFTNNNGLMILKRKGIA